MLLAGDEIGTTHNGNNNTYCHDNEINWIDWSLFEQNKDLLYFTRRIIRLRREQMVFRRRKFFHGRFIRGLNVKDISWINTDGKEMQDEIWNSGMVKCLGVVLVGNAIQEVDEFGERIAGDTVLLLMNASAEDIRFILPESHPGFIWELCLDTYENKSIARQFKGSDEYTLKSRSSSVFILFEEKR